MARWLRVLIALLEDQGIQYHFWPSKALQCIDIHKQNNNIHKQKVKKKTLRAKNREWGLRRCGSVEEHVLRIFQ